MAVPSKMQEVAQQPSNSLPSTPHDAAVLELRKNAITTHLLTDTEVEEMDYLGNRLGNTPEETARWRELEEKRISVPAEVLIARGLATRHLTMFWSQGRRWFAEFVVERDDRYRADGGGVIYDEPHFMHRLRHLDAASDLRFDLTFDADMRAALVPPGSHWRRGSQTYRIIELDQAMIIYRNLRAAGHNNHWDTIHAFLGPSSRFRRIVRRG